MKLRGWWLLAASWLISAAAVLAGGQLPTVEVWVDTTRVMVGDPFVLTLRLRYRPGEEVQLPSLEEWLQRFAPRPGPRQEPSIVAGFLEQVQRVELRLFELGDQQIPPLPVVFVQAEGDTLLRVSEPIGIRVSSARTVEDTFLRDIKPPLMVPGGGSRWLLLLLVMVLLAGLGAGLYWFTRRPRERAQAPSMPTPIDYAAEFCRIAGMGLVEKGDYKSYYSLLADTLRRYLGQRFGVEAMERTTSQLVAALPRLELENALLRQIEQYLQVADLVKFARFLPSLEHARQAPEEGIAIITSSDSFAASYQPQVTVQSQMRGEQELVPIGP